MMDFNGAFLAQPSRPDHIGKNYLEWKTSDVKYPQKMSIEVAKTKGQARRIEGTSSGKNSVSLDLLLPSNRKIACRLCPCAEGVFHLSIDREEVIAGLRDISASMERMT